MEQVNLLNLPPSEKLVAILDGELNQNEAGSFFQDLYQNQELQDQFFDLIQIKNNFRNSGVQTPDFLKSNILKGIGLAAASTITYQTVATNNVMTWGSNILNMLGSKISIAMMSALCASLVTFGIMSYDKNKNDNPNLVQNQNKLENYDYKSNNSSNNSNNSNNLVLVYDLNNINHIEKNNSNPQNYNQTPNSKIPITNSSTNSQKNLTKNRSLFKTKNTNKNTNVINDNIVENSEIKSTKENKLRLNVNNNNLLFEENSNYDNNSLIPGKVPESKYKVEKISKNIFNNNPTDNLLDNENLAINKQNLDLNNLPNQNLAATTIDNNPNNDLDFYNPESTKNLYFEQDSKMSFHFRNFSAKTVNDLDIPQMNSPMINNIGAGILYEMSDKWSLGVEIGQENFEQEFKAQNGNNVINLQQNHLAFWGGALVRYNFNNTKVKSEFNPYVNMLIGSTDIGPLVKPSIGVTYNISNDFAIFGAGEYTAMYSKYNSVWYNTQKYGFTYGFILKF